MTSELVAWLIAGGCTLVAAVAIGVAWRRRRSRDEGRAPDIAVDAALARLEGELGERVRSLDDKLSSLTDVFVNDRARGNWGELTLARVLEEAGLRPGHDFELQTTTVNGRPDAVVILPDARRIVIDAKFPLARLREAVATDDPGERRELLTAHGAELVKEAKSLVGRGYLREAAGGFVVMYLPDEGIYTEAMTAVPGLYEEILALRVLLAGPTTLIALLRAAGHVLAEHRAVASARDILDDAKELRSRMATFMGHLEKMGRSLNSAVVSYNSAVGSWTSRLDPQMSRLCERASVESVGSPAPIDAGLRLVSAEKADTDLQIAG